MTQNSERDEPQRITAPQGPAHKRDVTRRKFLVASGAAVAAVGVGGVVAASANAEGTAEGTTDAGSSATGASAAEACYRLTGETTEGPYYIDADKIRKDITEDRDGIPFTLRLKVIDSDTCKPLRRAAVDIWHCDALGIYSGYESLSGGGGGGGGTTPPSGTPTGTPTGTPPSGDPGGGGGGHEEPTDDERYLRGTQLTDQHGYVEFKTVFPGWYRGRAVHIHTKVHVGGKMTDAGYEGGHTCHTGQFFFAETAVLASADVAPYATSTTERTTLDEDTIYGGGGTQDGLLKLKYRKGHIEKGVIGSLTMGVDPDETHDGTS
ncbi:intradiol ring-cleavage dioxygenase [Streptomyces sp. MZ04]|uniref:intradiol ring-cleavage dioxygenase n=1 Tax=Streptomyces sp. MZ04 TaxID=2559236 RepID=UPI00107EA7A3|nr:intradiol ring-cleavage dioxygenase [Streptomyces sp. MZ04]TGB09559.1 twin-arginine translocation signal domain-containing protein [Streptomyces sp. MZ04]